MVGLKKDLRLDPKTIEELKRVEQHPVTVEEGQAMALKINAYKYLERSARTREGVKDVFDQATRAALSVSRRTKNSKKCLLF